MQLLHVNNIGDNVHYLKNQGNNEVPIDKYFSDKPSLCGPSSFGNTGEISGEASDLYFMMGTFQQQVLRWRFGDIRNNFQQDAIFLTGAIFGIVIPSVSGPTCSYTLCMIHTGVVRTLTI